MIILTFYGPDVHKEDTQENAARKDCTCVFKPDTL